MTLAWSLMRWRVASAPSGLSRSARETVAVETPSASAIVDSLIFCASVQPPRPLFKQFKRGLCHSCLGKSKLFRELHGLRVERGAVPNAHLALAVGDVE